MSCDLSLMALVLNLARVQESRWTGDIVQTGPGIGEHSSWWAQGSLAIMAMSCFAGSSVHQSPSAQHAG